MKFSQFPFSIFYHQFYIPDIVGLGFAMNSINKTIYFHIFIVISFIIINLFSFSQTPIRYLKGHEGPIIYITFSPDGKELASVSADKTIKLWDITTGNVLKTLFDNQEGEVSVCFSPDEKCLVSGSWDKNVKLWDIESGKVVTRMSGHTASVRSVSFAPNDNFVASAGWDKEIIIWYAETGLIFKILRGHNECIRAISYSSDGKYIASAGYDLKVKIWDVYTGKEIHSMEGHKFPIESISYSPDGQYLATGSIDNTVKIWNTETGKLIKSIPAHNESVYSVSFSPDGKYIASAGQDKTIKIWDAKTGANVKILNAHTQIVKSVCFSPDGKFLVSAGNEKDIYLWDISFLNIKPFTTLLAKSERIPSKENKELIKWIYPTVDSLEVYQREATLSVQVISPTLTNYRLFINRREHEEFDGQAKYIVKPSIKSTNDGFNLEYNVYLYEGLNIIQLYAESSPAEYYFSKQIKIFYRDISEQAENSNLFLFVLNVPSYIDKKLNEGYTTSNCDELINLLKTQEGKIFKQIIPEKLSLIENTDKKAIEERFSQIITNIKKDDIFLIIISSYIVTDIYGNYYILPSDINRKQLPLEAININNFLNQLEKFHAIKVIYIDISKKLPVLIKDANNIEENSFKNYLLGILNKEVPALTDVENNYSCHLIYGENIFELIKSGLSKQQDKNKNSAISIIELNEFIKEKTKKDYFFKGKDLPIYMLE